MQPFKKVAYYNIASTSIPHKYINMKYRNDRNRGNRGANYSGLSRIRKGLTQNGITGVTRGGRNKGWMKNAIPVGSLRSGSVAQFLNTMTLCAIFFGMVRALGRFVIYICIQI